jgi:predicted enzyme related to lactoylglutathione lyase
MSENTTGRFVWYELMTTDPKAAVAFYGEVVGWKTQPFEGSDYLMWVAGQGPLGGVMTLPEPAKKMGAPPHWMGHVEVADVDKTVARVRELGGQVHVPPSDIPKVGRFAVIADPQGASISLFKPEGPMTAHDVEKHGEVCWHELYTTDYKAAFAFYHDIVGWEHIGDHDMGPMGTYLLYGRNGKQMGGMMNKAPGMPTAFGYYIQVDDLKAAFGRAQKLGAKVLNGPIEVPGGAHVVMLVDPQGAAFSLHERAPAKS